jgi:L-2-hydroxyglutarate oxidase
MVDDFAYEITENSLHVLNAPSPAATACLAIADDIVFLMKNKWNL